MSRIKNGFFALLFIFLAAPVQAQINNPGVVVSGNPANNDCVKFVVAGGHVQSITTSGDVCLTTATAVVSFNTRFGAVVPAAHDYNFNMLDGNWTLAQGPTLGAAVVLGSVAGGIPAELTRTQLTALLNPVSATLPGAAPAFPNDNTKYYRGDGVFAPFVFSGLGGNWTLAQGPTLGAAVVLGSVAGGIPAELTRTQLTALLNAVSATLPGAMPAFPNNTTTYMRGDGTYATLNCAALASAGSACSADSGTTGHVLGFLDGVNHYSAEQRFGNTSGANTFSIQNLSVAGTIMWTAAPTTAANGTDTDISWYEYAGGGATGYHAIWASGGLFRFGDNTRPVSTLETNGSWGAAIVTKTGTYTATVSDYTILCDATSAPFTVTVPNAASTNTHRIYNLKKIDSSANSCTVGSNSIDNAATKVLSAQYQSITIQSDGSKWWIL